MNYIEAVEAKQTQINLSIGVITVKRLPLLQHHKLISLRKKIDETSSKRERISALFDYIKIASGIELPEELPISDIPMLLSRLIDLNENIALLPWQVTYRAESKKTNLEYAGRELATIVDMLAHSYGWHQEFIFSLQPDVAACYVQEILMDDWHDREFEYKLSEVAYDEKGKYVPFNKPDWYVEITGKSSEEAKGKIPRRFVPDGVVIRDTLKTN